MKYKILVIASIISIFSCGSVDTTSNNNIKNINDNKKIIGKPKITYIPSSEVEYKEAEDKAVVDNKVHIVEVTKDSLFISQLNDKVKKGFLHYEYVNPRENSSGHAKTVLNAFLDFNINNKLDEEEKTLEFSNNLKLYNRDNINIDNLTGIINMSYGVVTTKDNISNFLSVNDRYNDKEKLKWETYKEYFSKLVTTENYNQNEQLKIKSLGNTINTEWGTAHVQQIYQTLNPLTQKKARNDLIYVKNVLTPEYIEKKGKNTFNNIKKIYDINNKEYYEINNNAKAMLLRSFTVAQDGFLDTHIGSSLSAPRVTRLAYELKKKYPFLRYNQIKHIILTTTKSKKDYLDNYVGWGIVDNNKALKGLGALNAGLVEEEIFYEGMKDKVTDSKGNFYAYYNIPTGTYTWENDIEGGLTGNSESNDDTILNSPHKYRIPKVLDSEKNYYKTANFRKDGNGTLILTGKQLYNTTTQVLGGTLDLRNDSNSKYEVFDKATLKISNSKIDNDVENQGKVEFDGSNEVNNYYSSTNSETLFKTNSKLKGNEVMIAGNVSYNGQNKRGEELVNIEGKKLNTDNAKLNSIFLKFDRNEKGNYVISDDTDRAVKYLKNLNEKELRNIPSYNLNAKKFFDEYENSTFSLANLNVRNELEAFEQIFTDNYTTNIIQNYETIDEITRHNIEELSIKPKDSIYINSYSSFSLKNSDKYSKFTHSLKGITLGIKKKIKDIDLGIILFKYDGKYKFLNGNSIDSKIYSANVSAIYNINNFSVVSNLGYLKSLNNAERLINSGDIKARSKFSTNNLSFNIGTKYLIKASKNIEIVPELGFKSDYIFINKFSENIEDVSYKKYEVTIKNNIIKNNQIKLGLAVNYTYKNLNILNKLNYIHNFNDDISLNAVMNANDLKLLGKKLTKDILEYILKATYRVTDKFEVTGGLNIDTQKKLGISLSLTHKF